MPTINFLSWNIQNYGSSKFYEKQQVIRTIKGRSRIVTVKVPHKNRYALINLICKTAKENNANLISILELSKTTAENICYAIQNQLDVTYGIKDRGSGYWNYSIINWNETRYKSEVYALFWRSDQGFERVNDPSNRFAVLRGLTNKNTAGNDLKFQRGRNNIYSNGRPPGFFAFKTTGGTTKYFTVLCYHAMFNDTARDYWGVNSYPQVAPVTSFNDGTKRTVSASLLSGDLNVDLLTADDEYDEFATQSCILSIKKSDGSSAKTTLIPATPVPAPTHSLDYRVNAYDNIAAKGAASITNAKVIDMIKDLKASNNNPYNLITGSFNKNAIASVSNVLVLPPADYEDAWELYKYAVSDHLPVFATITF